MSTACRMLQDPEDGVLFLAYTPRQPSIGTENMLRCAYRAGLRGEALLKGPGGGGWRMRGGPDRILQVGVPRASSSHSSNSSSSSSRSSSSEVDGRDQDNDDKVEVRNLAHGEERQAVDHQRYRNATQQCCRGLPHASASAKPLPRKPVTGSSCKGCRQVLLCFWLFRGVTQRRTTASSVGSVGSSHDFGGSKALPPCAGRAPGSLSEESAWVTEWESFFPGLRCRDREVRDVASEPVEALACRPGGGHADDDHAITDEYLWGRPIAEFDAGKKA